MIATAIPTCLRQAQAQVQADLEHVLRQLNLPELLQAAVSHAVLLGGKRVRPALVYAAEQAVNPAIGLNTKPSLFARRAAVAVELIHCYSLVHDDLPCMDDDALRRGQPTCHIQYGEANALLAGDILQSIAFAALTGAYSLTESEQAMPLQTAAAVRLLAQGANRMVAGQVLDLQGERQQLSLDTLQAIHEQKTGALICSALGLGALAGKADDDAYARLQRLGQALGLAFQVQDDILDVTSTTEQLGKPAASDLKLQKSTYPALLGLTAARDYAQQLHQQVLKELDAFPNEQAQSLRDLTTFLLDRQA